MKDIISFFGVVVFAMFLMVSTAFAKEPNYTLYGGSILTENTVELPSSHDIYSGIEFQIPEKITFKDTHTLSADFKLIEGVCGQSAPRFIISVLDPNNQERNLFVYLGEFPGYSCRNEWQTRGDLLDSGKFIDLTEAGGFSFEPYEAALKNIGDYPVTRIELVADGGWMYGPQKIAVDNVSINDQTYQFE